MSKKRIRHTTASYQSEVKVLAKKQMHDWLNCRASTKKQVVFDSHEALRAEVERWKNEAAMHASVADSCSAELNTMKARVKELGYLLGEASSLLTIGLSSYLRQAEELKNRIHKAKYEPMGEKL